jgi:hypothetical protein
VNVHVVPDLNALRALNLTVKPVVLRPYEGGSVFEVPRPLRQALHFAHALGPDVHRINRDLMLNHLRARYAANREQVNQAILNTQDLVFLSPLGRTALVDDLATLVIGPLVRSLRAEELHWV